MGGIPYRKDEGRAEADGAAKGGLASWLRGRGRKVAGVGLLLLLAGGYAAWKGFADEGAQGEAFVLGEARDATGAATPGGTGAAASGAAGSPSPTPATIRVQIGGAVAHPGIYSIPKGAILDDLVRLAGGFTADADVDRINRVWTIDRSLLVVIGTKASPSGGASGGATGTSGAGAAVLVTDQASLGGAGSGEGETAGPLDLNAATAAQLDALPGIGPTTAGAIVAYREKNGPFARTEDLMKVSGIKRSRYDAIKDLVRVG